MTSTRLFDRAIVRLSPQAEGEDVREFLQGLITNDVLGALPVWAALLTPQGKVLFDFLVWDDPAAGADLLLDCETDVADALAKRLSLYRLRRKIGIARDESLAVHWRPGNGNDPRLAGLGARWLQPVASDDEAADGAWLAHRLALGVTEGRAELGDGETLWLECNAAELGGVSFAKGCYIGQENTARMNWRQKVSRRLVVVPLERSDPARRRIAYPALGLAVDHLRIEKIDPGLAPAWFQPA